MATVIDPQTESVVDSDMLYEVVDGEIVEKKMGTYEMLIGKDLYDILSPFVHRRSLGRTVFEIMFVLPPFGQQRRPDLAFVSFNRWPKNRRKPKTPSWDVVPDLAIEIISPSNLMSQIVTKIGEYFDAGVQQVWVVLPEDERVYVYDSPDSIRVVKRTDDLTGDPVIPGFRLPLAELFADESDTDDAPTA